MALVRVAILGTIGKGILLDTTIGTRVAALEVAVAAGAAGGITAHNQLTGLQVGDDHPQYALVAAIETISAPWNFAVLPFIGGVELDEFIEDTIGNELENSSSIYLTYSDYGDTHGKITAHINNEYVEDLVGSMLLDTSSIDLTYNDANGTISAALTAAFSGANPTAQIGLAAVNGVATNYMRSDGAPALDQGIAPTWTAEHIFGLAYTTGAPAVALKSAIPAMEWWDTDGASNAKRWMTFANSGDFATRLVADDGTLGTDLLRATRVGNALTAIQFGNATDLPVSTLNGTTILVGTAARMLDINSTTASGPYMTWLRSGVAKWDLGFAPQLFSGGTADGAGFATRGATPLEFGTSATKRWSMTDDGRFNMLAGPINLKGYIVATLPAGTQGDIAYVTNALAPTFGAAVVGGGAVVIPVFYDGTNWVSF